MLPITLICLQLLLGELELLTINTSSFAFYNLDVTSLTIQDPVAMG